MANDERLTTRPPSWLRLNGYGVLVALLEVGICVFYFLAGGGGLLRTLAHAGMGLAGLGLLHSYARSLVVTEVYASALLVVSNLLAFYVQVRTGTVEPQSVVLQAIIVVAVTMRVSALMQGGTVVIPGWRRRDAS